MQFLRRSQSVTSERRRSLADLLPRWFRNEDIIRPQSDPEPGIDEPDPTDGTTKLHRACALGNIADVRKLLYEGANINAPVIPNFSESGYTALHYAVKNSHYEIVQLLLTNRSHIDASTIDGLTPLHIAAGIEHIPIISTLINHGANIYPEWTTADGEKCIPLHIAMRTGVVNIVRLLLDGGAKKCYTPEIHRKYEDSTFRVASKLNDYVILAYVFTWHVNFNKKSNKIVLLNTVAADEIAYVDVAREISKWLFKYFKTMNREILLPGILHGAAQLGYLRVVRDFLKWGVNVNTIIHPLHERVPDGPFGYTVLHTAAKYNHNCHLIKLLLSYGADINAKDSKFRSPIYFPIKRLDISMTNLLSDNGAVIQPITSS